MMILEHPVVEDGSRDFWHTFLVPDAGYSAIISWHGLLYSRILRQELRADIPFVPHIGVGTKRLWDLGWRVAQQGRRFAGTALGF